MLRSVIISFPKMDTPVALLAFALSTGTSAVVHGFTSTRLIT